MGHPPVVVVASGGVPRTQVLVGTGRAPALTVADSGARPITLTTGAPPVMLFNPDGSEWTSWSPLDLGASLIAWWTTDRADLITLNSTAVTSWKDVVGGYDAVQAVSAARPIYSATSFNGAPGVSFDGVDDELTSTDAALLAALPDGAEPGELWGVAQQNALVADSSPKILASYGGATSPTRRGLERVVATGVNRGRIVTGTGASAPTVVDTTVDLSSRHVMRGRWTATDNGVAVDNATEVTAAVVPATTVLRLRFGSISNTAPTNFWSGPVRDILATGSLTAPQIAALNAWALVRRML